MYAPILKTTAALLLLTTSKLVAASSAAGQNTDNSCEHQPDKCGDAAFVEELVVGDTRLSYAAVGLKAVRLETSDGFSVRLDDQLTDVPGIGLFRRANSFTSHPTTQGLTMRGVGANAAGRVLVSLDGVPQNDPFGGWVYWSQYDALDTAEVHILKGGGAGAFGAQALAGSLDMRSPYAASTNNKAVLGFGSDEAYSLAGRAVFTFDDTGVTLSAGRFETDGDFLLNTDQRGAVDVRAASEATRVSAKIDHQFDAVQLRAAVRYFEESRVNGLSQAVNDTEALDLNLTLTGETGYGGWELVAYYRNRDFANVFVAAREERSVERPVLDQFDVPAWGAGVLARAQFGKLELGLDGRRMSGETNERFRNLGVGFTRQRRAGGDQWIVGLYGEYEGTKGSTDYSVTLRMDRWRTYNGERLETNIADGTPVRAEAIANRKDWVWSGRAGLEHAITGAVKLRAAGYKSWRLPTLNEYYRPFRVVNDITEANPELVPEKLYGLDVGLDYQPISTARLSATLFRNWLRDGVGNVTIGFGPGFFPLGGFVPAGGVLRQRANIDGSVTDGLELDAHLKLQNGWQLTARYLYARARITAFDAGTELIGKRPVQTPRHSAVLGARYAADRLMVEGSLKASSGQYDDDLNTRRLGSIFTMDIGAKYKLDEKLTVTASAKNLFDAKIVSGRTATGLETIAQRRFFWFGIEATF